MPAGQFALTVEAGMSGWAITTVALLSIKVAAAIDKAGRERT